MALVYTNRRGQAYYVLQGLTKSGKPKYYCALKSAGVAVDVLPADFEIYEHPRTAMVSIRRVKPSRLLPAEAEFLKDQIRQRAGIEHFILDRTGDSFEIYVCDRDPDAVNELMQDLCGPWGGRAAENRDWVMRHATYSPMFRLTLTDETRRLFSLERWCYRGSIDRWITVAGSGAPLDDLAAWYLPHLGKESFYDLM